MNVLDAIVNQIATDYEAVDVWWRSSTIARVVFEVERGDFAEDVLARRYIDFDLRRDCLQIRLPTPMERFEVDLTDPTSIDEVLKLAKREYLRPSSIDNVLLNTRHRNKWLKENA